MLGRQACDTMASKVFRFYLCYFQCNWIIVHDIEEYNVCFQGENSVPDFVLLATIV
jgi:hypothetical protein